MKTRTFFVVLSAGLAMWGMSLQAYSSETRSFQETAVEINGTKFWLPSTITVKKGDHVKIKLVSKVPGAGSVHGFQIEGYDVKEVADSKGKEIEFTADKAGIFPIHCHLHPAHVGGQLVVME
jgi:plastocyanin